MDQTYQILTDATVDLSAEIVEEFGLKVIPMPITLGGKTFHHHYDYREMSSRDFYDAIRAGAEVSTAQINLLTYLRAFLPPLRAGKDIVYLCFSSGLSGTIQTARMVMAELQEKFPQRRILCVDTLCASVGQGLLVYEALRRQRDQDYTLDQLLEWVEQNKTRVCHWFTVEDLNHLYKGGRLSRAAAVAGTMLQIKPILTVDDSGHLSVWGKARGTAKAYQTILDQTKEVDLSDQTVIVGHSDNPQGAEKLRAALEGRAREVLVLPVGPVIGAHTGAGLAAVVYFGAGR